MQIKFEIFIFLLNIKLEVKQQGPNQRT